MTTITLKIEGMDCAEEIAIIRRALKEVINNPEQLSFDLLNGKLGLNQSDNVDQQRVIELINKTGMKATPWEVYIQRSSDDESWWQIHGRKLLTIISGLLILLGSLSHGLQHGFLHIILSPDSQGYQFPTSAIVCYVLAMIAGGWYIFPKAYFALCRFRPDMNLLMTIAVIGALAIGEWFEGAAVAFLFSVALLLESWSVGRARRAIQALLALAPASARVLTCCGSISEKKIEDVAIDSTILVKPGEKIPLDGVISKGFSSINQAPITGESIPVEKNVGDDVYAGSINGDGAIEFKSSKAANDSTLARIIQMVEQAQSRRAASEQWVESFAKYYTPAMMLFALLVAVVPPLLFGGIWDDWIYEGLVILVIACPCALVISTPVSIVAGLSSAARAGILIKGGSFLELPARLKALAFDKTGTLTIGKPVVQKIVPLSGHNETELLAIAAALEANSQHPLAQAITERAREQGITIDAAENFQAIQGKGARASYQGKDFWIGSHRFVHDILGENEPQDVHQQLLDLEDAGHSVMIIGNDIHICGLISVADALREETPAAINALKQGGLEKVMMLTGDNRGTARAIADICDLDEFEAELLPEDKVKHIELLVAKHKFVAMVGDGINDAPAMAVSSLGIAMGAAGSDAAIETADIALMSDDLTKLPWLLRHSKRTLRIIKQNIIFSLAIKVVFIGLALMSLATLWMAIAADMGASLIVIANGLRLLKAKD